MSAFAAGRSRQPVTDAGDRSPLRYFEVALKVVRPLLQLLDVAVLGDNGALLLFHRCAGLSKGALSRVERLELARGEAGLTFGQSAGPFGKLVGRRLSAILALSSYQDGIFCT